MPTQHKRANGTRSPGPRIDRTAVITATVSAAAGPRFSGRRAKRVRFAFENRRRFCFRVAGPCGGSFSPLFAKRRRHAVVAQKTVRQEPRAQGPEGHGRGVLLQGHQRDFSQLRVSETRV